MQGPAKALAYSALAAALGVILLLIASVLPGGKMVLVCVASLGAILTQCLFGWRWALGTFGVTAFLALLLLPAKAVAIYYTAFFGYYPLLMVLTERLPGKAARYAVRLAVFNAVMIGLYFAAGSLLSVDLGTLSGYPLLLLIAANVGFLIYDTALQQGMLYCMRNIARRIK